MSLNGVVLALLLTIPVSLRAQPAAWRDDVKSIDGVMRAYYEVVSGPAGSTPDRARDEFLHHPDALIGMPVRDSSGTETLVTMSLAGFYERVGGIRDVAFYEWEISRRVERFGMIAHVWSTYASSERPDGEPQSRGINSIQLHFDGERWWIMGWIYDRERPGKAIPEEYLKEPGHDD